MYEFVLSILILGGVGLLIAIAFLLVRRPETGKRLASGLFLTLLTAAPAVLLMLSLTTSINYGRDTFAEAAGYELRDSAVEELESLCYELVEQINEVSGQIPTDQMGCLTLRDYPLHQKTKAAMQNLGTEHPTLSGYYPDPKPVTFSWGMSHLRLTGMYSPFTVEANYNAHCPDSTTRSLTRSVMSWPISRAGSGRTRRDSSLIWPAGSRGSRNWFIPAA